MPSQPASIGVARIDVADSFMIREEVDSFPYPRRPY